MTDSAPSVNGNGTIAPLRNVALFRDLLQRLAERPRHLPGMGLFYGFSGYGKTFSAIYGANKERAFYIEMGESWTKKKFCQALLTELGVPAKGTVPDLVEQIQERLSMTRRPLIIDEADHVVRRGFVETIREIHDKTHAPIVLLGEELMPQRLTQVERVHNRLLDAVPAQPADVSDGTALAQLYAPGVTIAGDLMAEIVKQSDGRARRVCINIEHVRQWARMEGRDTVALADWGDRGFHTGQAPARRA
jgi:DNA transposition AAA+ family ATPase